LSTLYYFDKTLSDSKQVRCWNDRENSEKAGGNLYKQKSIGTHALDNKKSIKIEKFHSTLCGAFVFLERGWKYLRHYTAKIPQL